VPIAREHSPIAIHILEALQAVDRRLRYRSLQTKGGAMALCDGGQREGREVIRRWTFDVAVAMTQEDRFAV
jgi:hypothetical protein